MSDLTLTCSDCGNEFVFTEGEQEFYSTKGLPAPSFCPICRGKHNAQNRDYQKWHPTSN